MLEKYLTKPINEFQRHMRANSHQILPEEREAREAYSYSKMGSMLMRSQLDCADSRLPGTGVFDIKTRATRSVRYDVHNHKEASGYRIESLYGKDNSFENEWRDLMRNAFLKYSLQARIGNMDGIFIAYHNTSELAGFQYLPLETMDNILSGSPLLAQSNFNSSVVILQKILETATAEFPEEDLLMTFETPPDIHKMNVWVQPKEWHSTTESRPLRQYHVISKKDSLLPTNDSCTMSYRIHCSDATSNMATIKAELSLARQRQAAFSDIRLSPDFGIQSFLEDQKLFLQWRPENNTKEKSEKDENKSEIIIDKSDVRWRPISTMKVVTDNSINAIREKSREGAKITAKESKDSENLIQWKP